MHDHASININVLPLHLRLVPITVILVLETEGNQISRWETGTVSVEEALQLS